MWATCLLAAGALAACSPKDVQTGDLNVIPLPQEVTETADAAPFVIRTSTTICYPEGNAKLERTAHLLASYIKEVTGTEVKTGTKAGSNCIVLGLDPSIAQKEGYVLTITEDQVTLNGQTEAGVFYGAQTIHDDRGELAFPHCIPVYLRHECGAEVHREIIFETAEKEFQHSRVVFLLGDIAFQIWGFFSE